jgi:hypothetical protein
MFLRSFTKSVSINASGGNVFAFFAAAASAGRFEAQLSNDPGRAEVGRNGSQAMINP